MPSAASGLRLSMHEMTKLATMVMKGGTVDGKQVVPADWLEASFTPSAKLENGLRYGFLWWLGPQGDPPFWAAGFGNGEQRMTVNQNAELVVLVFAGNYNAPDAWELPVKIITDFVVPELFP